MKTAVETPDITNEVMTWQQIKDKVGNGWAIISNPEFNGQGFVRGELFHYGYNKSEVYQKDTGERKHVYYRYCGKRDPNIILML